MNYISLWLENMKAKRARKGKEKLSSWIKSKEMLKKKLLPSDFEQKAIPEATTLSRYTLSVHEYTMEFDKLSLMCDLEEKEPLNITRYIKGLNRSMTRKG